MASNPETTDKQAPAAKPEDNQACFAIMPISDHPDYPAGHFSEVYESIISPSAAACGYTSVRADEVAAANLIHLDILKRILEAPMAICDLSSANPNVMFELGLRQAFDRPVVLIKDGDTRKIFDIDNIRTITYDSTMRPRSVQRAVADLTAAINATRDVKPGDGLNSIVGLLGLHAAALKRKDDDPAAAQVALFENSLSEIKNSINRLQNEISTLSIVSNISQPSLSAGAGIGDNINKFIVEQSSAADSMQRSPTPVRVLVQPRRPPPRVTVPDRSK